MSDQQSESVHSLLDTHIDSLDDMQYLLHQIKALNAVTDFCFGDEGYRKYSLTLNGIQENFIDKLDALIREHANAAISMKRGKVV